MNSSNTRVSRISGASSLDDVLSGKEIGLKSDEDITAADIIDQVEFNENMEYTEFDDEASGSFTYHGDDYAEQEFMRKYSNFDDLVSEMEHYDLNPDENPARTYDYADFIDWAEGHFMRGQQYRGFKRMSEEDQRMTRTYDYYLDRATLDKGIVVTRRATPELLGIDTYGAPPLEKLNKMRGKVVYSPANMSTGLAKNGLAIGHGSEKTVEYRIHIPAGSKGAGMWIGDERINGWGGRQREFMTNRDSLYSIGSSDYDEKRGIAIVNLYYIGRTKHKY